ncbi:MAG TPA: SCO family protein [Methylomirabilota bacterium]|nr:SCO family protein [Methylomirabilota bacterium]
MDRVRTTGGLFLIGVALALAGCGRGGPASPSGPEMAERHTFAVTGVVHAFKPDGRTVIIAHETIPGYMEAMTMPFQLRETNQWQGIAAGDRIAFRLTVTESESWIDEPVRLDRGHPIPAASETHGTPAPRQRPFRLSNIPALALTNEFGRPISFAQFEGSALALTFFFTRCPIPEYCPRLSRNFAEAARRLKSDPSGPTNWHLLSISFDPFDTPEVLRRYAATYRYDSNHWSFVTGASNDVRRLARAFGVSVTPDGGTLNHGFATAIFDTRGRLQNMWPVGGDTTDMLVAEIRKAAAPDGEP